MASASEFAGGSYLKPADITEPVKATVESCIKGTDYDGNPCLVLNLAIGENANRLQLNKTKVNSMINLFGDDYEQWSGKEIGLNPGQYEFQGTTGPTIDIVEADDLPF